MEPWAEALLKDDETAALLYILNPAPDTTRLVGGAVRDALLGQNIQDIDLATQLTPEQVTAFCEGHQIKVIPTGIDFGTVTIVTETRSFEITTLREDIETDGRHAVVKFGLDWTRDAERRDFTLNALYLSQNGTLHQPVGGLDDLRSGVVKFIGDAGARIKEDYLRIWRFFRFSARYAKGGFDEAGIKACTAHRAGLAGLSAERIKQELWKLLIAPRAAEALALMSEHGLTTATLGVQNLSRFAKFKTEVPVEALAALSVRIKEDAAHLGKHLRLSRAETRHLSDIAAAMEGLQSSANTKVASVVLYRFPKGFDIAAKLLGFDFSGIITPPAFPVKGADLLAKGFSEGPDIGEALKRLEALWIDSDFELDKDALLAM